ncbi:hypothetical protein HDA32_000606 [Spinactinospora alkalitolerans]|uniref:ANTAR domain-containing protein n=1 Tax=Spinactinospora alkalitolerans TaxID=687207 RepID=A0A852TMG9_9ACTN|nr:ANTAR domain-containing protein [Spinactinospora alkalitolerans]NYE45486.1 hypothetical protein [Spinactinospora alkalitolerans]
MDYQRKRRDLSAEALTAEIAGLQQRIIDLYGALGSRATIDQAIGAVMAVRQCDAEAARQSIARISQNTGIKLCDVAAEIVAGPDGVRTFEGSALSSKIRHTIATELNAAKRHHGDGTGSSTTPPILPWLASGKGCDSAQNPQRFGRTLLPYAVPRPRQP